MKTVIGLVIVCVGLLFLEGITPIEADAQTNYAGDFLSMGMGARALGMGGAFVAVADDSTAAYWNPAGLSFLPNIEVAASNLNTNSLETYSFVNYAQYLDGLGAFAVSYIGMGSNQIPLTTTGPQIQSYFNDSENAMLVSWGERVFRGVAVGATVKYLFGGILNSTFSGWGMDVGVLFKPIKQLKLGMNVQDITGTSMAWQNTPTQPVDIIPVNVKIGAAYSEKIKALDSLVTVALDADTKYDLMVHGGLELWYRDTVVARVGFQSQQAISQPQLTLGAGFIAFFLELDYAYFDYDLTPLNYFSVIARF